MKKPDILVKWLHIGMASCVVLCVGLSLVMDPGVKTLSRELVFFNLHKFIGINFVVISLIYLLWSAKGYGKALSDLFPWFRKRTRSQLWDEARKFNLSETRHIASAVHGLGIVFALVTCVLGLWLVLLALGGTPIGTDTWLSKFHYFFSLLTMVYVAVHVAAALLHGMVGHKEIFEIGKILDRRSNARAEPRKEQARHVPTSNADELIAPHSLFFSRTKATQDPYLD